MQTAFDVAKGRWNIHWPGCVAQYDLVYLTPPTDPMHGIPLGNGTVGALCWCEGSKLIVVLNRCDLWDDAKCTRFENWSPKQEEFSTTLRHAGRLILDFQLPVFDTFYLVDFEARLNLAEASMTLKTKSPFGRVHITLFVDHDTGDVRTKVDSSLNDSPDMQVTLERFGSRTFSHWYQLVRRNPRLGLGGTNAAVTNDSLFVSHGLTSGIFAVGTKVEVQGKFRTQKLHRHAGRASIPGGPGRRVELMTTVTGPRKGNPVPMAKKALSAAPAFASAFRKHKRAWKSFWRRSFMDFGDDYLNNLWHLTMFYANASQRGKYPGRFINSLWTWNRDVQNWNFYFHWNQQQTYWPLNAAGHHDLVDSYLEYRFTGLPHAKKDAQDLFGVEGAVVSDVCERRGYNSKGELGNHTPVAEIALDFWRQYRFTGDEEFLVNRARPYLVEAARFFAARFILQSDGLYHGGEGVGYEGCIPMTDVITEHACARALFSAAIRACDGCDVWAKETAHWKDILHNLAPFPTTTNDKLIDKNGKMLCGKFAGRKANGRELLASGICTKTRKALTSWLPWEVLPSECDLFTTLRRLESGRGGADLMRTDLRCNDGIFPWAEFSAIFPSNVIGLKDRGSRIYRTAVNTVRLFSRHVMGWAVLPIALARLGLAGELAAILVEMPDRWQFYPNGWGHYGPLPVMKLESSLWHLRFRVRDAGLDETEHYQEHDREENKFPFEAHPFRHMGLESMSCLSAAMNEALLQSHDGRIRIAPAVGKDKTVRFTLHAIGGFVVSAEVVNGKVRWVHVQSLRGGTCRIANPWTVAYVSVPREAPNRYASKTIELEMRNNETLLLTPTANTAKTWTVVAEFPEKNTRSKTSATGQAELGLPRMF